MKHTFIVLYTNEDQYQQNKADICLDTNLYDSQRDGSVYRHGNTPIRHSNSVEEIFKVSIKMVIHSFMSKKDVIVKERKMPPASDSRWSMKSRFTVELVKSMSSRP